MARSTKRIKTTKLLNVSVPAEKGKTLPYDSSAIISKGFSFSFEKFDREPKLFNLGYNAGCDDAVSGKWFLDLLDCLKDICGYKDRNEWRAKRDLHPVDWDNANANPPPDADQLEYWQFRINKSRGRVIGYFIDETFYIVWLDPHHNLTNSEGYGKATYYARPKSEYEEMIEKIDWLEKENERLKNDLKAAEDLLNSK